jgi:hypothetical protein
MEGLIGFVVLIVMVGGVSCHQGRISGKKQAVPIVREGVIEWCIEKPADCKKEYEFNKVSVEIERIRKESVNQQ